jgi:hypothetical protein
VQRTHATAREAAYRRVDPDGLARTLPGVATVGGPVLVAFMGRPQRFANGVAFKSFTGLTPRASETGETDRKGQPTWKGRLGPAPRPARLLRPGRPTTGPAARRGLPPADDRPRRPPHQGHLCRGRQAGRAGLDGAGPRRTRTCCATWTAARSPPNRPGGSSPTATPSPTRSAAGAVPPSPPGRRRPPEQPQAAVPTWPQPYELAERPSQRTSTVTPTAGRAAASSARSGARASGSPARAARTRAVGSAGGRAQG